MENNKVQKTTLIGSILTAILASICCIGPLVFAILGISGAGFILKFEAYRPLFIVLATALLGTAFYFTYKKKPAADCADGTYCANPKSDRINKMVLWIATVLVVIAIFFPTIISKFI
jgi:mercuric ion transport protein